VGLRRPVFFSRTRGLRQPPRPARAPRQAQADASEPSRSRSTYGALKITLVFSFWGACSWFGFKTAKLQNHKIDRDIDHDLSISISLDIDHDLDLDLSISLDIGLSLGLSDGASPIIFNHIAYCY
jgi:hypothetical protein